MDSSLEELQVSLFNLTMAYLNYDSTILVWGDFQKYEIAFTKILNGSLDTNIPYQSEHGLI